MIQHLRAEKECHPVPKVVAAPASYAENRIITLRDVLTGFLAPLLLRKEKDTGSQKERAPMEKKGKSFGKKGKFKGKGKGKGVHYNVDYDYAGEAAYNYFISIPQVDVYVLSLENQGGELECPSKGIG